jgi:hypothetical protein
MRIFTWGVPDLDPETPANQIDVYGQQEDGTSVLLAQPIRTGAGGVPMYNGSPVVLRVEEYFFSIKVLDRDLQQIYYNENVAASLTAGSSIVTTIESISALTALTGMVNGQQFSVTGYNAGTKVGGGEFVWDASSTATENLVTIFESDAGGVGRFIRIDVTAINTDYSGATRASGNDDTAAIQSCLDIDAAIYIPAGKYGIDGGLTWSFNALRMTGDGISSWLEGENAHTITVTAGQADGVIEHLWVDQIDTATTLYDAIHLEAGEMHVNFVDVDFADRYGIYVGAYRTNVFQYASQACLGGSIYIDAGAYGFCGTDILLENAGLGVPNYGILANGQRAVIKGVSSFNIGSYVWDLAGSYNSGVCASATFSTSGSGGAGTYGDDAYKVSGSFNAEAAVIARGTVGVAHHITGNSNATAALISDNCSKQALKITGTNNDVSGGRFSGAGTDTTSPTVEVTGDGTTVRGNAAAPSTTTNAALQLTASDCEATGRYNGIVDVDGSRNTVVATMGRVDVGTGGSNFVAGTVAGGTGVAVNVSSNSQALAITVDNADTQIATVSSTSNIGFIRGFGASGDGITISGDANCLQLSASGSGGNDIVVSGDYNQLNIYALGNVVITGTASKNTVTGVIRGNLTFDVGSQGNRFYGKVLGTVTDSGSSNDPDYTS